MSDITQEKNNEIQKEQKTIIITNEYYKKCDETNITIHDFYKLFKELKDEDPLIQLKGLIGMRKLCIQEKNKEAPKKLFNVLINYLVVFIKDYSEAFQNESLICLKNIEKVNLKVDCSIKIPFYNDLITIVLSRIKNRKELKMEKLTLKTYLSYIKTIINSSKILREMLSKRLIDEIINIINEYMKDKDFIIIKKCLKVFFVLFLKRPDFDWNFLSSLNVDFKQPEDILKTVIDIMNKYPDEIQLMNYSLKIIERFSFINEPVNLDKINKLNILPKIIELADNPNGDIICLALKIIGNFAMNNNSIYTQILIDLNVLEILKRTLKKEYDNLNEEIRKESSFIISNIAAGNQEQVCAIYEDNFYEILTDIIKNEEESPCKINCLWALYNLTCIKNQLYIKELVQKGIIKIIINRFNIDKGKVLGCSLEALCNLLEFGRQTKNPIINNIIEKEVKDLDVFNAVKNLNKNDEEEEIYQHLITKILKDYMRMYNVNNI